MDLLNFIIEKNFTYLSSLVEDVYCELMEEADFHMHNAISHNFFGSYWRG